MIGESKVTVTCPKCKNSFYEDKVEFINIEEDILGDDILTFICPRCKTEQKGYRRV